MWWRPAPSEFETPEPTPFFLVAMGAMAVLLAAGLVVLAFLLAIWLGPTNGGS